MGRSIGARPLLAARAMLPLVLAALGVAPVHAQDEVRDSGSRASRAAEQEASREAAKEVDGVDEVGEVEAQERDEPDDDTKSALDTDYHLAVFGGYYAQDSRLGLLLDGAAEETLTLGDHRASAELAYLHDPFSTKTFNFADDDQDQDAEVAKSRVVQPMHELDGELAWRGDWERWLRTDLKLQADAWWPSDSRDRRWSIQALPSVRFGGQRGVFGRLAGEVFLKKYPNYFVSDRRIDSSGGEISAELGHDFGALSLSGGFEYRATNYLDARYDTLLSDGTVGRATESKAYRRSTPFLNVVFQPDRTVRLSLRYKYELHDSRHYDRRMTGRDESGALVAKLIPSYYDYNRHRAALRARYRPHKTLTLELVGELWLRDFDTYEARDADNVWTGDKRSDTNVEVGIEGAYRLLRFGSKAQRHELLVVAFGSHLDRGSNMEREVSFATNFQVTRAFAGLELRGP